MASLAHRVSTFFISLFTGISPTLVKHFANRFSSHSDYKSRTSSCFYIAELVKVVFALQITAWSFRHYHSEIYTYIWRGVPIRLSVISQRFIAQDEHVTSVHMSSLFENTQMFTLIRVPENISLMYTFCVCVWVVEDVNRPDFSSFIPFSLISIVSFSTGINPFLGNLNGSEILCWSQIKIFFHSMPIV